MPTLIFHKPYGVLSQFTEADGHPGLAAYIDVPGVYAAGRLDHDSEGLLLLTDDHRLQHRLTDPQFEHPKTYWAQVEGAPDDATLAPLKTGVPILGKQTLPAKAWVLDPQPDLPPRVPPIRYRAAIPTTWIALTLHEGRNRQVRRMTAAVGFPTLRLLRVAIGPLTLEGLAPGQWREVAPAELAVLGKLLRGKPRETWRGRR